MDLCDCIELGLESKAHARGREAGDRREKVPSRYRVLPYPNPEGASTRQDERYRDTEIRISLSVLFDHD